jgi:hypothetical protein
MQIAHIKTGHAVSPNYGIITSQTRCENSFSKRNETLIQAAVEVILT